MLERKLILKTARDIFLFVSYNLYTIRAKDGYALGACYEHVSRCWNVLWGGSKSTILQVAMMSFNLCFCRVKRVFLTTCLFVCIAPVIAICILLHCTSDFYPSHCYDFIYFCYNNCSERAYLGALMQNCKLYFVL